MKHHDILQGGNWKFKMLVEIFYILMKMSQQLNKP